MEFSIDDAIHGLETNEFYLEYMPIVYLSDGRFAAVEALVRWKKGDTTVSPLEFIPEFEQGPLIGLLTYWVIERIAADLGPWLRDHPEFHVAINVPPELFGRGGLHYAAKVSGLDSLYPQIVLEMTERGVPDETTIEGLRFARRLGLGIAVDDIDATNLTLLLLARANVDYLKLDKSLVDRIGQSGFPPGLLKELEPVLALGRPLVVAEGIETGEQLEFLRAQGVQLGQGWLISQPLSVAAFFSFYQRCSVEDSSLGRGPYGPAGN